MDAQKKLLVLAFKRPDPKDPWINHLAAWWCHGFCHVELILETVGKERLAFSIEGGGKSRMAVKTFAGEDYKFVELIVSMDEHKRVCDFCDSAAYAKYPYGNLAMVLAILPSGCVSSRSSKLWGTFCSKIVTEALQRGGLEEVETLNPSYTTPATLFRAVERSKRRTTDPLPSAGLLEAWV